MKDGQLVNAKGEPFRFEFLLDQPEFERVALPFVQNLARLGISANVRTVDPAQYENRMQNFDFDMTVVLYPESLSPGNEQRDYWTAAAGKAVGGRNLLGIDSHAVDALVDLVVNAPDRLSLVNRVHALDRVLLEGYYVMPNWHFPYFRVAYWDKFGEARVSRRPMGWRSTPGGWTRPRRPRSTPSVRSAKTLVMLAYALRRVLLIVPTLFGIIVINFVIVQSAPGGPVDQMIAELRGTGANALERVTGGGSELRRPRPRPARPRPVARGARPRSRIHRRAQQAFRLRQAAAGAFLADGQELSHASISATASSATVR